MKSVLRGGVAAAVGLPFSRGLGAGAAVAATNTPWTFPNKCLVSPFTTDFDHLASATRDIYLSMTDLGTGQAGRIPIPFRGHGVAPHPRKPGIAIVFSKFSPLSGEVDLGAGTLIRTIGTTEANLFYGHGVFSPDGQTLFNTESQGSGLPGVLRIRDAHDYRIIGRIDTNGALPHDCRWAHDNKTLIVANGTSALRTAQTNRDRVASLVFIEASSGKLLERVTTDEVNCSIDHFELTSRNEIIIACTAAEDSQHQPGPVFYYQPGHAPQKLPVPANILRRMVGHSLSVAVDEARGVTGVTVPDGDMVLFWRFRTREFVCAVDVPRPTGITMDPRGGHFIVSNRTGNLQWIHARSLELDKEAPVDMSGGNISHMSILSM